VVERLVTISARYIRFACLRTATCVAFAADRSHRALVQAKLIVSGEVDEVLRINCSLQMIVQISALGHLSQECQRQRRRMTNAFKIAVRPLLRSAWRLRQREDRNQNE